jgi:hypothetical protein
MDFQYVERLAALNTRKIERDRVFILREKILAPGLSGILDGLGSWMVAKGKKLHERYSSAYSPTKSIARLQDTSKIFRTETQL